MTEENELNEAIQRLIDSNILTKSQKINIIKSVKSKHISIKKVEDSKMKKIEKSNFKKHQLRQQSKKRKK